MTSIAVKPKSGLGIYALAGWILSILCIMFLTGLARANDDRWTVPGIEVGAQTPGLSKAYSSSGDKVVLKELHGKKGVVIAFVRSADWCPFCKAQLINLNKDYQSIKDKGYELVAISYDDKEKLDRFTKRKKIAFPLISDPKSTNIKSWGVLNENQKPGSRYYGIPHPVIFVVGTDNKVIAKLGEEKYRNRPSVDAILEVL